MARHKTIKKRLIKPDPVYDSRFLAKLINRVMKDGEKSVAQKLVYSALDQLKAKTKKDPMIILKQAIDILKPQMEVRSRRVGGAAYQVPVPVRGDRRESLAFRWLVMAARARSNTQYHTFSDKLVAEIESVLMEEGAAIDKRNQTHRMAEANKAFSHFRR